MNMNRASRRFALARAVVAAGMAFLLAWSLVPGAAFADDVPEETVLAAEASSSADSVSGFQYGQNEPSSEAQTEAEHKEANDLHDRAQGVPTKSEEQKVDERADNGTDASAHGAPAAHQESPAQDEAADAPLPEDEEPPVALEASSLESIVEDDAGVSPPSVEILGAGASALPASSAELSPGTYTVSANVSLEPLGFPAFATSRLNPEGIGGEMGIPADAAVDNATLVVGEDGTATLTVDLVNPVFTVQSVGNGSNVTVVSATRSALELKEDDDFYNQMVAASGVTDRITTLVVELGDWSGAYRFGTWSAYATTFDSFLPGDAFASADSLDLSVDLAHAQKRATGSIEAPSEEDRPVATELTKVIDSGTYAVTANLAMSGAYNPLIPGVAVYANSPDNPFGQFDDNDPSEVHAGIPQTPLSMNASIVVREDGAAVLLLPIKNPVFTLQALGASSALTNVATTVKAGPYGSMATRINMLAAELPAGTSTGSATYDFSGSVLYAAPLDRTLAPAGDVALQLTVDYDSMLKTSEETVLPEFAQGLLKSNVETGATEPDGGTGASSTPEESTSQVGDDVVQEGGAEGAKGDAPDTDPTNGEVMDPISSDALNAGFPNASDTGLFAASGIGDSEGSGVKASARAGDAIALADGHMAAGTYTVSANIWVDRSEAGLPLSPHFTNSSFPPSSSVARNAQLRVEGDGHAFVTVPLTIQSRLMVVKSLSGLNIVSSSYDSNGGLSSITVDLGILKDTRTVTKNATATVQLGTLARTIIGGDEMRTWSVTFEVAFGLPTQVGGDTAAAQALLAGRSAVDDPSDGQDAADAAAADALAALDAVGAAGDAASESGAGDAAASADRNGDGVVNAADALAEAQETGVGNLAFLAVVALLVAGAAAGGAALVRKRAACKPGDGSTGPVAAEE